MVRIFGCGPKDRGSIPRSAKSFFYEKIGGYLFFFVPQHIYKFLLRKESFFFLTVSILVLGRLTPPQMFVKTLPTVSTFFFFQKKLLGFCEKCPTRYSFIEKLRPKGQFFQKSQIMRENAGDTLANTGNQTDSVAKAARRAGLQFLRAGLFFVN